MIWICIISGLVTAVLCYVSFRIGFKTGVKEIMKQLKQVYNNSPETKEIKDKESE